MNKNLHAKFAAESLRQLSAFGRRMMEACSVLNAWRKERVAVAVINPHYRQADPGSSALPQEYRQIYREPNFLLHMPASGYAG